jgi:hypothetical protein
VHNRRIAELVAMAKAPDDAQRTQAAAQAAIDGAQAEAAANAATAAALGLGLDMFIAGQQIRALRGR